jgi:hypothetical protein
MISSSCRYSRVEVKFINQETPMNRSKTTSTCKALAIIAMLSGAMVSTLPAPAFGQQDVNPTWFDFDAVPHAIPNQAVLHPAALHPQQPAVTPVSTAKRATKIRPTQSTQPKITEVRLTKPGITK